MRNSKLLIIIFLAGLIFNCSGKKDIPPNILFIITDDHAVKAISAYDTSLIQTPNIDRIATAGALFNRAFVTNSICAPSRATILTGKFSHLNGQIDNHQIFDGDQMTFPKLLQNAGYQTALIGKWHLKSNPQGFDYWNILPGQGYYYNPDFNLQGEISQVMGYATDLITDFAIGWLKEKRNPDKPFFMFYNHKAPHRNWMPALRHLDTLENRIFPEPPTFWDQYESRLAASTQLMHLKDHFLTAYDSKINNMILTKRDSNLWKQIYEDRLTPEEKTAWELAYEDERLEYVSGLKDGKSVQELNFQRYIRDYLRCVMAVDENIGRMLDYLDDSDLAENTIIIYVSDQGFYLGEHGWFDKRWMYEESMRMPFLIRYPEKISSGQVREEMVMNIDLAPTVLDFAGISVPEDMQGKSLKPMLEGDSPNDWREAVYYHYYEYPLMTHVNPHYGVRTDRYKLIHFYGDVEGWELYDLKNDPNEVNNIYNDDTNETLIKQMKEKLNSLRVMYKDEL